MPGRLRQRADGADQCDFYEDLDAGNADRILDDLAAGKTPQPGPQIGRQLSEPIGGETTLTDPSLYGGNGKATPAGTPLRDSAQPTQDVDRTSRG